MSLIHTPMPDSVPARYFSFQLAGRSPDRQYLKVRGELAARDLVPDRGLVPGGDVGRGPPRRRRVERALVGRRQEGLVAAEAGRLVEVNDLAAVCQPGAGLPD